MNQKKLALSFTGGLAKGGSYLGVLKALLENNIQIDMLCGSSIGAVVASLFALGISIEQMYEFAEHLNFQKLLSFESLIDVAILSDTKFYELINPLIKDAQLEETKIKTFVQVTNHTKGKLELLEKGPLKKILAASCAWPFFMPPIQIFDKDFYIDGSITAGFSSNYLKEQGAEIVIGITPGYPTSINSTSKNPTLMFMNTILLTSKRIMELEQTICPVDIIISNISPEIGPFEFNKIDEMIDIGYKTTCSIMPQIKNLIF